jgi:hypothetical protein
VTHNVYGKSWRDELADGFAAYRKSEVLLHMHGNPTNQELRLSRAEVRLVARQISSWKSAMSSHFIR